MTNDSYSPDYAENEPDPDAAASVNPDAAADDESEGPSDYHGPYLDGPIPPSPVPEDPSAPAAHMDAFADVPRTADDAVSKALADDDEPIEDDADMLASLGPTYHPDDEPKGPDTP